MLALCVAGRGGRHTDKAKKDTHSVVLVLTGLEPAGVTAVGTGG